MHMCVPRWSVVPAIALAAALAAALLPTTSLDAQSGARSWEVLPEDSDLFVLVERAGLLSFLGHRHAIIPEEWRAELCLEPGNPPTGTGRVVISTESLVIDSDSALALAGLEEGPDEDDVRELQEKMLSAEFLSASEHPRIVLEATEVRASEADGPATDPDQEHEGVEVRAELTIRGITREVSFPVEVEEQRPGRLRLSGTIPARQTAFEIEPESVAGVVNVADEVELHFDVAAERTEERCSLDGR